MWVFDGEEWTQDNGGVDPVAKPDTAPPQYEEELLAELQVVEVVRTPRSKPVPPFPMA